MKKLQIILSTIILVLVPVVQFAQDPPTTAQPAQEANNHSAFLGLLRSINTMEVDDFYKYGSYSSWQILQERNPEDFNALQRKERFADMPEILPGWSLRFNVHADGQGYDVRLEDLTDQTCGYAAITDESGVIRQSKAINCSI